MLRTAFDIPHSEPLTPEQVARLSPAGAAAYHILSGDEPGQVERNLDALSPEMQHLLQELSPSTVVGQMSAPIYLLHDRHDSLVPFTESVNFASELARLDHPHQLIEFSIFQHTTVSGSLNIGSVLSDAPQLFGILHTALMPST
jgi:hypothetical protein